MVNVWPSVNRELRIADDYLRPLSEAYINILTAMASRRSLFNRNGVVADQYLITMVLEIGI